MLLTGCNVAFLLLLQFGLQILLQFSSVRCFGMLGSSITEELSSLDHGKGKDKVEGKDKRHKGVRKVRKIRKDKADQDKGKGERENSDKDKGRGENSDNDKGKSNTMTWNDVYALHVQ